MTHAPNEYRTACIIAPIADSKVEDVKKAYPNVLYRPDGNVSDEELKEIGEQASKHSHDCKGSDDEGR